jgi:hypothetical protein
MDKELLKKAVVGIEKYSQGHCLVACVLIELECDYQATASIPYLISKTGLTKPTVYSALSMLQKDKLITKNQDFVNTYIFDKTRVQQLTDQYLKKISIPDA